VISNQIISILVQRNTQAQLATLSSRDILIRPALGDASAFDFGNVARVIGVGEKAARESAAQFAALAVSERDMQQYALHREALRVPPPRIDFVTVEPGSERYAGAADTLFGDLVGKPLDPNAVARRMTSLYGRGGLDTLDYRVIGEEGNYGLAIDARPASEGRYYLRFGLSLQDDFQGNSTYTAAMRFVMSDITRNAGEWVTDLSVGANSGISSELFLPLAQYSGWFVMPRISDLTRDLYWYQQQNLIAKYRLHTFDYGLDLGYQFGNWGEIRVGAQREQGHYVLSIGDPSDSNLPVQSFTPYKLNEYFVRLSYDRLDDINFPRSGQQVVLQYSAYRNASGIVQTADQVTGSYIGAYSFGRDTLSFSAAGGTTLQANVTDLNLQFPLGGFLNLSGLRADSLLGPNYGIARALFYRQIGRGGPGYFDLPTYLGLSLEMGNVWQSRSAVSFGNTERNASLWLGLDTFIGPIYIASGFDTHGNVQYYLFLGRPFYGPR
jgi:NTE family protein